MTETSENAGSASSAGKGGLSTKLMPELRQIASGLGVRAAGMKKADLVAAIRAAQGGQQGGGRQAPDQQSGQQAGQQAGQQSGEQAAGEGGRRRGRAEQGQRDGSQGDGSQSDGAKGDGPKNDGARNDGSKSDGAKNDGRRQGRGDGAKGDQSKGGRQKGEQSGGDQAKGGNQAKGGDQPKGGDQSRNDQSKGGKQGGQQQGGQQSGQQDGQPGGQSGGDDDEQGGRRNRRRRGRDRQRSGNRAEPDTTVLEDDVLTPCAGILDVLDNYAFVRTSGYLPGTDDVYVSLSMVRKFGLRRGDAITGQVRQPREGERREKFNPLVQIDTVNGADPESAEDRSDFGDLTPVHPSARLRLETGPQELVGRVLDLLAPVGKGQRGLILSPPQAGKTRVLQAIARAVTANNPECHLMIVLVDVRPEEVTEFQRSIKGEVIASSFDRAPVDHTTAAELAIERAKRLVELGHDVVVLLDGITRLGRAYDLTLPSGGRTLAGGVDAAALHPTKRFFGAARSIENGGSLTILATAEVETASPADQVFLDALEGTANMQVRLRRDMAEKRIFPAVDAVASSTRREEEILTREELAVTEKLRRSLVELDPRRAAESLLARLARTQTNYEFLVSVQRDED